MDAWEREAREEIRELVATYTHLGDGGRVADVARLFEPDGVLELSDRGEFAGHDAIAGALGGLADGHEAAADVGYVRHHVTNLSLDVEGPDRATGRAYWTVVTATGLWTWGRYRDVYTRRDGGPWRFAHRKVRADDVRDPALAASPAGPADLLARVERLESLHAIGQLADRYAQAADARDLEGILGMFVDDVDCGRLGTGREALRASYEIVHRHFYRTIHQVTGHVIDLADGAPDRATGRVVMRAEHEVGDRWIVVLMCLFDTYERRDGSWYFVRRKPETWYSADITEQPRGPAWTADGWGDAGRPPRLPHLFSTWDAFWDGHDETVRRLTQHP